jgi:vitamin B12 transporter
MISKKSPLLIGFFLLGSFSAFAQDDLGNNPGEQSREELPALSVEGQKTANLRPVTTYESPISNLDFDPRVDMQSRNMAEAQGDLTIRGGIFENTGIQVGAASLLDPQTGHYTTELPIAPEMLSEPVIHTGAANALLGFNSSVGTVGYSWSKMTQGGSITVGAGDHDLNFQRLHNAWTMPYGESGDWTWGAEFETSRSESDGSIPFGDHDFDRTTGRVQLLGPKSQTDLFAGYQEKFFGWPKLYTPYGNETESLKTRLVLLNHKQQYGDDSHWELTTFHRRHSDHYFLDAFGGINIIHETEVAALGLGGSHVLSPQNVINYAFQSTVDEIESSSLKNTDRTYFKFSLLPEHRRDLNDGQSISFKAGASFDDTNRDGSKVSPIAEISWLTEDKERNLNRTYLSYAESTQVAGYTAIGGNETRGLFRSNHDLARETTKNLELGHSITTQEWMLDLCVFYRWDDDLTDWTYFVGDVNRTANPVDTKTFGGEIICSRKWQDFEVLASYGYLSKDEDYKKPDFVGSFYALNFPRHRVTLGVIWDPSDLFQIRVDNEWREQRENLIREGPDQLTYSHLAASYYPTQTKDLELFIAYDKPWDEDFQDIPGTPGRGDQFSFGGTYRW